MIYCKIFGKSGSWSSNFTKIQPQVFFQLSRLLINAKTRSVENASHPKETDIVKLGVERQLHNNFFIQFGHNIQQARQLRNAVFAEFFDKS